MKLEDAKAESVRLNTEGKHRTEWFYYPACYYEGPRAGEWFVLRRRKRAEVSVAVFFDGTINIREQ